MMSNALCVMRAAAACGLLGTSAPSTAPATAPTTGPAGTDPMFASPLILTLLAVGVCVLVVWIVRRAARPDKLLLRRAPGRPNHLTIAHVILPAVLWLLMQLGAQALADAQEGADAKGRVGLAGHVISQTAWLAASLIAAGVAFQGGLARGLGLSARRWLWDSLRAVTGYLAVLPPCMGLFLLMSYVVPPQYQHEHTMLIHLRTQPGIWKVMVIVSAVVLAPLTEEVFFRGLLQSLLRRTFRQPWVAILAASAVFAAVHSAFPHTLPTLFVLAIALGYNYERTGRLLAPILIHAIFNAVNILVLVLG
jgi:membrane protease YdiL (CAAX protease family)